VSDFQLILLSEVDRTAIRKARHSGAFPLTQYRGHSGVVVRMAFSRPAEQNRDVSAEEIASWYTPIEACAYASLTVGKERAANAILQRLLAGQIEAAASRSSLTYGTDEPHADSEPSLIPARLWKSISATGSDLWSAGDARFFVPSREHGHSSKTYHVFGIRLNPRDVHASLPPLPPQPEPKPEPEPLEVEQPPANSKPETEDLSQKGPPVSDEHLKGWFELYQRVYSGVADTETNALLSARGMFPGKSVSRERVRMLRGSQKRGRKNTEAAK
jgi:hypothetical protein